MASPSPETVSTLTTTFESLSIAFTTPTLSNKTSQTYDSLRQPYNQRISPKPALIAFPKSAKEVSTIILAARTAGLKVQARSGGHSYASFGLGGRDGAVCVDLRKFQGVEMVEWGRENVGREEGKGLAGKEKTIAKVGAGVRLGNMARKIYDLGKRALPHGTGSSVGIGGHATMGGYGYVSRAWGLALDRIVAVDVVLADGRIVHANGTEEKDIFWAVKGAASSVGVVVAFYFDTLPAPDKVTYFQYGWTWEQIWERGRQKETDMIDVLVNYFRLYQDAARNGERGFGDGTISLGIRLDNEAFKITGGYLGDTEEFLSSTLSHILLPLEHLDKSESEHPLGPLSTRNIKTLSWLDFLTACSDEGTLDVPATATNQHIFLYATSLTVPESDGLSNATLNAFFQYIQHHSPSAKYFIIINLHGGPGSSINSPSKKDPSFSAYPDRETLWTFQIRADSDSRESREFVHRVREVVVKAQPQTRFGASLSYVDAELSREKAWEMYYGDKEGRRRVTMVKRDVDPDNVFWNPHAFVAEEG